MRSQIRQTVYLAGFAVLTVVVSAGPARAAIVFSNMGNPPSYDSAVSFNVSGTAYAGQALAMPFLAGSTDDLTDAVLPLVHIAGDNTPITLDLLLDSSGQPGSILATLTQQGTIPSPQTGFVTFDYSGPSVQLTSGTQYWLAAAESDPNSLQGWQESNSDTGTYGYNDQASTTGPWSLTSGAIAAFQVDGSPVGAVVPEPRSLVLLSTLVTAFALLAVRRRKIASGR